jgi:hypothetical protein
MKIWIAGKLFDVWLGPREWDDRLYLTWEHHGWTCRHPAPLGSVVRHYRLAWATDEEREALRQAGYGELLEGAR